MGERTYGEDKPSEDPAADQETSPAGATPPIEEEGVPGQTQTPAPDATPIPPDDEMNRES